MLIPGFEALNLKDSPEGLVGWVPQTSPLWTGSWGKILEWRGRGVSIVPQEQRGWLWGSAVQRISSCLITQIQITQLKCLSRKIFSLGNRRSVSWTPNTLSKLYTYWSRTICCGYLHLVIIIIYLVSILLFMHVYVWHTYTTACVRRSEDNFQASVLFCYLVGSRD